MLVPMVDSRITRGGWVALTERHLMGRGVCLSLLRPSAHAVAKPWLDGLDPEA